MGFHEQLEIHTLAVPRNDSGIHLHARTDVFQQQFRLYAGYLRHSDDSSGRHVQHHSVDYHPCRCQPHVPSSERQAERNVIPCAAGDKPGEVPLATAQRHRAVDSSWLRGIPVRRCPADVARQAARSKIRGVGVEDTLHHVAVQ